MSVSSAYRKGQPSRSHGGNAAGRHRHEDLAARRDNVPEGQRGLRVGVGVGGGNNVPSSRETTDDERPYDSSFWHRPQFTEVSDVLRNLGAVDSDYQNNKMNAFGNKETHTKIESHLQGIAEAQRRMQQDTSVMVCVGALADDAAHRIVGDVVCTAQRGGGAGELPQGYVLHTGVGGNTSNNTTAALMMDGMGPRGGAGEGGGVGGINGVHSGANHHLTVMDLHDAAFEEMGAYFDAMEHRLQSVNTHMNRIHADVSIVCGALRAVDANDTKGND